MTKAAVWLYRACAALPLILAAVLYFFLPDTIPAHMTHGVVDRYGSRAEVFLVPAAGFLALVAFRAFFGLIKRLSGDAKARRSITIGALAVGVTSLSLCCWYLVWIWMQARP